MRIDARVLPALALASNRRVQAEPIDDSDTAFHRLWISGAHEERRYGKSAPACLYSVGLSLGLVGGDGLLLDLSQHAVVSVCFVMCQNPLALATGSKFDLDS